MPAPSQLQFVTVRGYQSQPVTGSTWLYMVDPQRPIGYVPPVSVLRPMVTVKTKWRATRRDSSVPIEQAIATDLGAFAQIAQAQKACQNDADLNNLQATLVFRETTSYQSSAMANWAWIYNVGQPSVDSSGVLSWRALKRDDSLTPEFQIATPIGNFLSVADAMAACQNDYAAYFPASISQ